MKTSIYSLILVCTFFSSSAQDSLKTGKRLHYFFSFNSGMLGGDHGKSITYTASTVHGITLGKRLRIGAGVGFDSYARIQTMPIFGQVHFDLDENKNGIFVQVNGGWAYCWTQKEEGAASSSDLGGRMFNPMVGYRISVGDTKLYLAAGYKFQLTTTRYDNEFSPYSFAQTVSTTEIQQSMQRFVLTLGVGWR